MDKPRKVPNILGVLKMRITKRQLKRIIREACQQVLLENRDYIPQLVSLITSSNFSDVLQGIDLAEAIGLVEIQKYEHPKQILKRKTYSTYKIFHKMILTVDGQLSNALKMVKHFPTIRSKPNDDIWFEYDRPSPGYLTIRYVEEGSE